MTSTLSTRPASSAWALFDDHSFSFETLRALGYAPYGGADIGEVTSTASRIPDGDLTAWYSEWRALAERIHADADRSAAKWHPVSARESYLRASNYYRLAAAALRAFAPYTLEGYAPLVTCPTLVLDGENDPCDSSRLYEALRCQKTYHLFPATEGGGHHCQPGAVSRLHQVVFDWLDDVLQLKMRHHRPCRDRRALLWSSTMQPT